jgi:hypothetical protein
MRARIGRNCGRPSPAVPVPEETLSAARIGIPTRVRAHAADSMWLPGWGQGGQANSARCGAQPQKWLRASGIARRTEPGWRYQAPASASGASNVKGASRGVLPSGSDDDGGGFTARCASSLKKRLRASGIARRRTEKERAEAFFPLGAIDDGGGFTARCASSLKKGPSRRPAVAPRRRGPAARVRVWYQGSSRSRDLSGCQPRQSPR